MTSSHVIPLDDVIHHELSDDCACQPHIEYCDPGFVHTHNAWDGRQDGDGKQWLATSEGADDE